MEVCKPAQQRQTGNGDEYEETSYSWQPGQFKQSATWGSTISQILMSVMILLSNCCENKIIVTIFFAPGVFFFGLFVWFPCYKSSAQLSFRVVCFYSP